MMTTLLRSVRVLGTKTGFALILAGLASAALIGSAAGALGAQERGAATAPVRDFDVGVRKTGPGPLTAGQTATFTLSPFNTGPSPVDGGSGVVVTDVLPANFTGPVTANGSNWTCTVTGMTVTCAYVGALVNGHQPLPAITITATAKGEGRYRNCAEIELKPRDTNPRDNNACVEGEIRPEAAQGYDVGIRKRGPEGPLSVGQTATFTLSPFNTGPSPVDGNSGVVVTDTLPSNFTAPVTANGMGAGWTCTVAGLIVNCAYNGPAVGANQSLPGITITAVARREGGYENCANIAFRPRDFGPRGPAIPVGGAIRDTNPRDNRDCIRGEVTADDKGGYDVGIRKRGPEGPLSVGQTATFTLSPFNTGPSPVDGASGVVVTDVLPPNFAAPVTANGAGWTCTVAGLTVTCSYGGSSVGASQPLPDITITAVAQGEGRYENCAEISLNPRNPVGPRGPAIPVGGAIRDANPRDNRDCIRGEVTADDKGGYDVGIRKRGPEGPLTVGQTATFTLSPFNTGPSPVDGGSGVVVTDVLPPNFAAPVTANGAGWTCTVAGLTVTCAYNGPAVGASQPLPDITITAVAQGEGRYENCAEISLNPRNPVGPRGPAIPVGGAIRDANPRDNRDCIRGEVTADDKGGYDVGIRKRGPEGPLTVGQTATFTLSPFNTGPSPVDGASGVVVTDVLPPNFAAPVTANGAGWTCTVAGLTVTCSYGGSSVGASQPLPDITITAVAQGEGRYENCAEISLNPRNPVGPRGPAIPVGGAVRDANPRDNRDCIRGEVTSDDKEGYDVSIRKLGGETVTVGGLVSFTLSPFNNGPAPVASVTVTDTLPAGLTGPVTAIGPGWTCTVVGQVVTCIYNQPPIGPSLSFPSITVQATGQTAGEFQNCAAVAINGATDTNPQDNRDCRGYVVTGPQTGTITIVKDAQPNGPQTFTFTSSPSNLPGFTLDDDPTSATFSHQNVMSGLQAGSYAFTEGTTPGWTLTGVVCTSAQGSGRIPIFDRWGNLSIQTVTVDLEPGDNIICTFTNVADPTPTPTDLTITKVGTITETAAGHAITYTVIITNLGQTPPTGTIHLIDLLSGFPAGTIYNSASGVGACSPGVPGTPWDCEVPASNLGLPITIQIIVPPGGGSVTNCATVVLAGEANVLNNEACVTNTIEVPPPVNTACDDGNPNTMDVVSADGICHFVEISPTGSITIRKDAQPNDAQDFEFLFVNNGSYSYLDDDDDGVRQDNHVFSGLAGGATYTFRETAVPGWTLTGIVCAPAAGTTVDIPNGAVAVNLTSGANVTCTFTNVLTPLTPPNGTSCDDGNANTTGDTWVDGICTGTPTGTGTITIVKNAVPDDPQDFFFLFGTGGGSFVLDDDGGATSNPYLHHATLTGLAAGPWAFTENAVPGWTLTGIVCTPTGGHTVDLANRTVTVALTPGAHVTCTFTNVLTPLTPPNGTPCDDGNANTVSDTWVNGVCTGTPTGTGTLTIVKDVQPGSDPQDFYFTASGAGLNDFWLDDDPSSAMPSSVTFTNLALGVPFTVTEGALSPWTVPSLQCYVAVPGLTTPTTDQLNRTFTVTLLDPGANVTCVFTNVR